MTRLFVGGLDDRISRGELEKEFSNFGYIEDVFVARNPPGFGFIVFEKSRDAERAIKDMDGVTLGDQRIRVEHARARGSAGGGGGGGRGGGRSDIKCYNCGEPGHMSRECNRSSQYGYSSSRARSRSRSPPRRRSPSPPPRRRSPSPPPRRRSPSPSPPPRRRSPSPSPPPRRRSPSPSPPPKRRSPSLSPSPPPRRRSPSQSRSRSRERHGRR